MSDGRWESKRGKREEGRGKREVDCSGRGAAQSAPVLEFAHNWTSAGRGLGPARTAGSHITPGSNRRGDSCVARCVDVNHRGHRETRNQDSDRKRRRLCRRLSRRQGRRRYGLAMHLAARLPEAQLCAPTPGACIQPGRNHRGRAMRVPRAAQSAAPTKMPAGSQRSRAETSSAPLLSKIIR